MKSSPGDQPLFTFYDMKRLFLRHRSRIKATALFFGIAVFALLLLREPAYELEATFKQASKQNELSMGMKEMFQQFMALSTESGTIAVMQSKTVLRNVVEELGMQAECDPDFFLVAALKHVWENLYTEFGGTLSDPDRFVCSDVVYSGERPLKMFVRLTESGSYQLFDNKKQLIGEGKLGDQLSFPSGHLALNRVPKHARPSRFYRLVVNPWDKVVKKFQERLKVSPLKQDKNILKLTFTSRDRFLGTEFLNRLMVGYQSYLKWENDEMCQKQLAHLQKRQDELTGYYDQALIEHAAYLKDNLAKNGFIGFAQEIETLSEPKNFYTSKLFDVDLELKRLHDAKTANKTEMKSKESKPVRQERIHGRNEKKTEGKPHLAEERKELVSRIENCDLDLQRSKSAQTLSINDEITQVAEQVNEATLLLHSLEKQEKLPTTPSLLKEPRSAIAQLVKQIAASYETEQEIAAADSAPRHNQNVVYLREFISQLQQKRQILEEDFKLLLQGADEFSGLGLGTAQGLLVEYTRQRDSMQAQIMEIVFLREQIVRPDFEMSSLGGVFEDGVTRELVNKSSAIALQLKDENNRSMREQERLIETLQTQKNFLSHYLLQTGELKRLRLKLLDDKIASLQQTTLSLLESEKELLKNKLQELNTKMGDLPEKWRRESLLMLKKEFGAMMLEGVSQLAEAKYLGQHIFQISSKPLDRAFPPVRPQSPRVFLISFVSALMAGVCCYLLIFTKSLYEGLPASDETLKLSGFPVSGKLSQYCNTNLAQMQENDLETLRHSAEFIASRPKGIEAVMAVCIGGKYPDYSQPLAELLSMRGLKTLVVQCTFDKVVHPDEVPGLWQYLHHETPDLPLRKSLTHDFLPSGGTSRHGAEIVSGVDFQSLLSRLKQNYDVVILYSSADAAKAEGTSLLKLADVALITVQQETKDELAVYYAWAEQKGSDSATFIYAEEFS